MTREAARATGAQSADATRPIGASGDDTAHGSPFKLERHVFYWMTQVVSRRDRQLNAELRRFRLRVPEYRVLGILRARQRLSLGEAAMTIGLDYTTMSRTVDRMVKAGRVLRVTDTADRRVTRLALTAEGTRLFDQVWPMVSRLNDVACARLPEGAMPLLCHALGEMVRSLEDSWRDRGDAESATDATDAAG
jgi:DNA-binding MarR family transcriptional regulator